LSGVAESYRGRHVRVFRLDREAVVGALVGAAQRLVAARPEVLEVRLFGSLARGDAVPGSDADLLIVLEASDTPFLDRVAEYLCFFTGVGIGCDVLPYTRVELARLRRERAAFAERLWAESRMLATRAPGGG
jgi:predicted nucleotidyltransferase